MTHIAVHKHAEIIWSSHSAFACWAYFDQLLTSDAIISMLYYGIKGMLMPFLILDLFLLWVSAFSFTMRTHICVASLKLHVCLSSLHCSVGGYGPCLGMQKEFTPKIYLKMPFQGFGPDNRHSVIIETACYQPRSNMFYLCSKRIIFKPYCPSTSLIYHLLRPSVTIVMTGFSHLLSLMLHTMHYELNWPLCTLHLNLLLSFMKLNKTLITQGQSRVNVLGVYQYHLNINNCITITLKRWSLVLCHCVSKCLPHSFNNNAYFKHISRQTGIDIRKTLTM